MGGAVAPGTFELEHGLAGWIALETLVGNRRTGDVTAQAFKLLALMGVTAYCRMQAEAVRVDAARLLRVDRPSWRRFAGSVPFAPRVAPTQCGRCRRPPARA